MAADAAQELKSLGATRADITADPRIGLHAERHSAAYPVPDFTQAARTLSTFIFRPVLGQSEVQDLGNAVGRHHLRLMPDLFSLSHVGSLFSRNLGGAAQAPDGNHIGLTLYSALHERRYDHMFYPDMTGQARRVLSVVFDGKTIPGGDALKSYGASIDLVAARERIGALTKIGQEKPSHRLQ